MNIKKIFYPRSEQSSFLKYKSFFPKINASTNTIDGKNVFYLRKRFGSPLYVVSKKALISKINWVKKTLALIYPNSRLAFSVKTNNLAGVVDQMRKKEVMAEVVSMYEYLLAKKVGYNGKQIIVNGPYKPADLLDRAIRDSALINIDNISELAVVAKISEKLEIKSGIGLRIKPRIFQHSSRFGFETEGEDINDALKLINSNNRLKLIGLHCHLGSNIFSQNMYRRASETICSLVHKIENTSISRIEYLDMGGGFPSAGGGGSVVSAALTYSGQYFKEIAKPILDHGLQHIKLIIEPGRALIDESVILLTSIISSRIFKGRQTAISDASISILPLAQTRNQRLEIIPAGKASGSVPSTLPTTLFGSSCIETDWLAKTGCGRLETGDIGVLYNAGAYNISQANQFINLRPATISITGNRTKLLRRKEMFADLYGLEKNSL
jgi:diaminopimelate decarboxylase